MGDEWSALEELATKAAEGMRPTATNLSINGLSRVDVDFIKACPPTVILRLIKLAREKQQ